MTEFKTYDVTPTGRHNIIVPTCHGKQVMVPLGETKAVEMTDAEVNNFLSRGDVEIVEASEEAAPAGGNAIDGNAAADLLAQADDMHHMKLIAEARKILGDDCPTTKDGVLEALKEAAEG